MKRFILASIIAMCTSAMFAGKPTERLQQLVSDTATECPIDIHNGWVIQTLSVDDSAVTVTMIIDMDADKFAAGIADPSPLREMFLKNFAKNAKRKGGLISEAIASDLPIEVDIAAPSSIKTITLVFTPEDLANALAPAMPK